MSNEFPRIAAASNLRELHAALIDADNSLHSDDRPRLGDVVDMTSLPTFGGKEPASPRGIWSWDAENLLVGDGPCSSWKIVSRSDYYAS